MQAIVVREGGVLSVEEVADPVAEPGEDDGTYAELVTLPAENVFPKPRRLSWEEAVAFPLGGVTAYRALFFTVGRLHAAETILVLAAGSGISTLAVCLAAQAGARVLVTSSSEEKLSRAGELGADAGVLSTEANWADEILRLTGGRGVDVVLDSVGSTWGDSLGCLRKRGTAGRHRRHVRTESGAGRPPRLPELALDPGDDDGFEGRLRRAAADGERGALEPGYR